ncbi:MAG: hypothetical protein K5739_09405 [Lachnospiraceae bacterium]|nr:hypothetical protein [Lachnospiraceae bacterium]
MKYKRKIMAALLCFVFALTIPVYAEDTNDPSGGFAAQIKASKNAAAECYETVVSIQNKGKDVNATVMLKVGSSWSPKDFETEVALPAGSTKDVTFMIPVATLRDGSSDEDVSLRIKAGDKLLSELKLGETSLFDGAGNVIQCGLLSDNPGKLGWMDKGGDSIFISGETRTINLQTLDQNFEESELQALSFLVIDDFDTSVLSVGQTAAIEAWVEGGGGLIIGTGERPETIKGLPENLVDAKINETLKGSGYSDITFGGSYLDTGNAPVYMIRQVNNGAIFLTGLGLSANTGANGEKFFSVDPSDPAELFSTLSDYCGVISSVSNYNNGYYMEDSFNYLEERFSMKFGFLKFVVILYVAISGPVLYLVLKKMNRREQIWVILPVVSLITVGLIYLTGAGNRIRGLQLCGVTVSQAEGKGNTHEYIYGYQASGREWEYKFSEDVFASCPVSLDRYSDQQEVRSCQKGDKRYIKVHPDGGFSAICAMSLQKNKEQGGLEFEATDPSNPLEGTIHNNTGYDLKFVTVSRYGMCVLLRDVKNGESVSTKDTTKVEKPSFASAGEDQFRIYASEYYEGKKYDEAACMAAISIAASDRGEEILKGGVLGVMEDTDAEKKTPGNGKVMKVLYAE